MKKITKELVFLTESMPVQIRIILFTATNTILNIRMIILNYLLFSKA